MSPAIKSQELSWMWEALVKMDTFLQEVVVLMNHDEKEFSPEILN